MSNNDKGLFEDLTPKKMITVGMIISHLSMLCFGFLGGLSIYLAGKNDTKALIFSLIAFGLCGLLWFVSFNITGKYLKIMIQEFNGVNK